MPPLNTITYLQVALWDNLGNEKPTKSGRKNGAGTRFKMDIEMWDVPAEKISKRKGRIPFVRNVQLRTVKEFRTMIKGAVKRKKLTADYGELLEQFINESPHDCMLGHVIDNHGGYNYHLTQFIRATFDSDGVPTLEIFNSGDCIVVDSFTDRFASGFIKYTAFRDFCGYQEYKRNK
ncbi:hypothetical protein JKG68_07310 [Microvirga aerilata]|uniref:Uncharacterized protein n=1 Tax=Microvirga aerilata TaxID=670292 RepID=A0A936Z7B9_9HYPH|nr:hypothetical protein [Microvirga aerilata]MBL0403766.1 hypothetical protein [Microvirga aerilata]